MPRALLDSYDFQKIMINLAPHLYYSISEICTIVEGRPVNATLRDGIVEHVLLDSREIIYPHSSLFFALKGRKHDGHDFLGEVYEQGVRHFVVSHIPQSLESLLESANFLLVSDTLEALHRLAAHHRRRFDIPVIAITGSNGKTIIKEWLFQLLYQQEHIVRSPRSYNSQIGVPLSVLQMHTGHTMGIFEAGISRPGEMQKLRQILMPSIGIFTNIGPAHDEGFHSREEKVREKLFLFEQVEVLIFRADQPLVREAILEQQKTLPQRKLISWSFYEHETLADYWIDARRDYARHCTQIAVRNNSSGQSFDTLIPFVDDASVENAAHCIICLLALKRPVQHIRERMPRLEPVAMRLELKEAIHGCSLINDSYNSDLTSLTIALNFQAQQNTTRKKTLILSDILQSGQPREHLYRAVAGLVMEKGIHRFIGVGQEVTAIAPYLPANMEVQFFPDTETLLSDWNSIVFREESILLKGARQFGFERIANRLARQVHNTILEVDMGALLHNLRAYQSRLQAGTRLMVMVKAGAYGSGSVEVAKMLEFQHVDYLGVAYADEGVDLRLNGIQLPIMVMNPEESTFDTLLRYELEPEIYGFNLLERFIRYVDTQAPAGTKFPVKIHLKLDTGMHRLGFDGKDLPILVESLRNARLKIIVASIFTHLAASESAEHDAFTHEQVRRFEAMYSKLCDHLGYRPPRHVLNSSGIVRFPEYQYEMVRLGLGLYGLDATGILTDKLQVVNTLKASISQIKTVPPGETVGYGRAGRIDKTQRIATISIGYADGFLRKAGNGRYSVLIHGKLAPTVGNVCMDMTMVNIDHIPEAKEGDPVIIFGHYPTVNDLAHCLETIPYEIFTAISKRVKRVYIQE